MTDLTDFGRLVPRDHGLIVVSTLRADGTIQSSVVNAGVLSHPFTGQPAVGFVVRGGTRKLANLRARPWATVVIRAGWEWAAAEGPAEIIGPDDPAPEVDAERLRLLLREIFAAAGGTHDDWDTYDKVMAQERRAAVLLGPDRVYSNARLSPAWRDDDIAFFSDWGFAVDSGSPAPGPRNTRARWPARPDSIG
jgi:PPOX class probable F420-dependent enzyme